MVALERGKGKQGALPFEGSRKIQLPSHTIIFTGFADQEGSSEAGPCRLFDPE